MLVYHTSDRRIEQPDTLHSRNALDFGKGFYVTRLRDQAHNYTEKFTTIGKDAYIHVYEYTPCADLKVKVFEKYDEEWLLFVCNCRRGDDAYKEFDLIEGGVANDKVFRTVDFFMTGIYDLEQALARLVYEKPNHQICFITQKAIDRCLKQVDCTIISSSDGKS